LTVCARRARAWIPPAPPGAAATSRSKIPTAQPSSARRRAVAAPMPLAPPVTSTVRSFNPRIFAPRLCLLRRALIDRAAGQHAGRLVSHHHFVLLVLHVDPGHDDAAIALRGGAHRRDLDFALHGVADPNRRHDLLTQLHHADPP